MVYFRTIPVKRPANNSFKHGDVIRLKDTIHDSCIKMRTVTKEEKILTEKNIFSKKESETQSFINCKYTH